jgi:uroporphyrinogen-III decarboxylase
LNESSGGGFIFNLGHGILPMTPVASVEIMLDEIRGGK